MLPEALFITATDTGVGKTAVAAAIALSLREAGKKVAAFKPVETGVPPPEGQPSDAEILGKACGLSSQEEVSLYSLKHPLAPAVAADREKVDIDVERIVERFRQLKEENDLVLVEGVGGLMVPIRWDYSVLNLIDDLGVPVLIVARPGLGTINHTELTCRALRRHKAKIFAVVLNGSSPHPGLAERTNPQALHRLTKLRRIYALPHCPRPDTLAVATALKPIVRDWFDSD